MQVVSTILVLLVAVEHVYILVLEMFLWTKPRTMKTFGTTAEDAATMKTLAANQGLYNGFLVGGLIWSLIIDNAEWSQNVGLFFLSCVAIAGIYGGLTASRKILYVQAVPALVTIALYLIF